MDKSVTISKLEDLIREASTAYYEGAPIISDDQFDAMLERLRVLSPDNSLITDTGHGYDISKSSSLLVSRPHRHDINKFDSKIRDSSLITISPDNAVVSPKLDGGSVECYYTNGLLDYVLSRGDGINGFDITNNLIHCVPVSLVDSSFTGMVRGEVVVPKKEFDEYWKPTGKYKSLRNMAVGLSQKKVLEEDERNALHFVAYTLVGNSSKHELRTKMECLSWIHSNMFEVVDIFTYSRGTWDDEVLGDLIRSYDKYLVDGIVITSKDTDTKDGYVKPHKELAYKTASDTAITKITKIEWTLSRTKKLVPVVLVEPTELSGATIRRVTAYNAKFITDNNIRVGSEVRIRRSGEIIPQILEVIISPTTEEPVTPLNCPDCGHDLVQEGTDLWCTNDECGSLSTVLHYIGVVAPIKGLGRAFLESLLTYYSVTSLSALMELARDTTASDITLIDGVGDTTANLASEMLDTLISPVNLDKFLVGLNIKGLSWKASEVILNDTRTYLGSKSILDNFDEWKSVVRSSKVNKTVKESMTDSTFDWIYDLMGNSIEVVIPEEVVVEERDIIPVAFTGKLSVPRKEFESYMTDKGLSQVDIKNAKFLITNTPGSSSSKNKKADNLGIPKVTEEDLRSWLDVKVSYLVDYQGNLVNPY